MRMVHVERPEDLPSALEGIGLRPPLPTLVVVGGADDVSEADLERLRPAFDALAEAAERAGAAVVDGGTDTGSMRLLGRAHTHGRSFPLVGVTTDALAAEPGAEPVGDEAALEPNHTHVVLVPGTEWGDEVPWLARVADLLAGEAPSLTVVANGGPIALDDAAASVASGRRVLALDGSGRAADALAAATRGATDDVRASAVAASGLVRGFDLREDAARLAEEVERILSGER